MLKCFCLEAFIHFCLNLEFNGYLFLIIIMSNTTINSINLDSYMGLIHFMFKLHYQTNIMTYFSWTQLNFIKTADFDNIIVMLLIVIAIKKEVFHLRVLFIFRKKNSITLIGLDMKESAWLHLISYYYFACKSMNC